jgi:hypothetical protein
LIGCKRQGTDTDIKQKRILKLLGRRPEDVADGINGKTGRNTNNS